MSALDLCEAIDFNAQDILHLAHQQKAKGMRFANIHAVKVKDGFQLFYTYVKPRGHAENYRCFIPDGQVVPSITPIFISAFFFENETHDLFGVPFEGISVDYHGTFYQVCMQAPMNPDYKSSEPVVMNPNFTAYSASTPTHPLEPTDGNQKDN